MKKRIASIIFTLALYLLLLPTVVLATEEATTYNIKVAGVQVTSENKDNITGNGISGNVAYNPDTNILTLTDATISNDSGNGIETKDMELIIYGVDTDADGTNQITGSVNAIKGTDEITITGTLGDITGGTDGGIYSSGGNIQIAEEAIVGDVSSSWYTIQTDSGNITINGTVGNISGVIGITSEYNHDTTIKGKVGNITGTAYGIFAYKNLNITETAEIANISGTSGGIMAIADVNISGKTGGISGTHGIYAMNSVTISGNVHSASGQCVIRAINGNIAISGTVGDITGNGGSGNTGNSFGIRADAGKISINSVIGTVSASSNGEGKTIMALLAKNGIEIADNITIKKPVSHKIDLYGNSNYTVYDTVGTSAISDDVVARQVEFAPVYTVSFVDHDGTVLKQESVPHGEAATAPADPTRGGYTFTGWDKAYDNITVDLTVTAQYTINKYNIGWDTDGDGTVDKTDTVEYGKTPTAPTASKPQVGCTTYTFSKWDKEIVAASADVTYTAIFTEGVSHTGKNHTENAKEATCKEAGYTGDTVCECGATIKKGEVIPKLTTHTWGDWKTTKEPTETTEGEKTRTCSVCGKTEKEVIPALGVSDDGKCKQDETCPIYPFTDTKTTGWYHDGVHFCLDTGLMIGTGSKTFEPDTTATRAMIVMILWRMEGSPAVQYDMTFADVEKDAWYTEAVRWAASEGIVKGYSDKEFGPNDEITREQLATILSRYCQEKGYELPADKADGYDAFTDASQVSEWAEDGMQWAYATGLIQGAVKDGDIVLAPLDEASRAQVATILYRFSLVTIGEE